MTPPTGLSSRAVSDLKPTQYTGQTTRDVRAEPAESSKRSRRPSRRGSGEKYRGFWPTDDNGRRGALGSTRTLIVVGVVVAVLLVAVIVVGVTTLGGSQQPAADAAATAGALPTSYVPTQSSEELAKLDNRAQDSRALTVDEVFPAEAKTLAAQEFQFQLAGTNLTRYCPTATWGSELHAALRKYGCNQIVRGVYVSKDNKHAGQFAVINLNQVAGSHELLRNLDPRARDGFVKPLTTPSMKKFGGGFSAAYAQASGHYVLIVWVQRLGGGNPASMNELVNASLAIQKADEFVWQRLTLVE
jgi:hypothetical protein